MTDNGRWRPQHRKFDVLCNYFLYCRFLQTDHYHYGCREDAYYTAFVSRGWSDIDQRSLLFLSMAALVWWNNSSLTFLVEDWNILVNRSSTVWRLIFFLPQSLDSAPALSTYRQTYLWRWRPCNNIHVLILMGRWKCANFKQRAHILDAQIHCSKSRWSGPHKIGELDIRWLLVARCPTKWHRNVNGGTTATFTAQHAQIQHLCFLFQ